jgi:YidC/Oxa1 family membrane protein insertase
LKKYREKVEKDAPLKELLSENSKTGTVLTKFAANSLPGLNNALFKADTEFDFIDVFNIPKDISFSWVSPNGVIIEKKYFFTPETYMIGLNITIKNGSNQTIEDNLILSLTNNTPEQTSTYGFEGPSTLLNNKLEKVKIKKIKDKNVYAGKLRWIAIQDRYFISSIIPKNYQEASMRLFINQDDILEAQYMQPESVINPGTQHTFEFELFFGPKSMKILGKSDYDLDKAINFGMFDFIAKPCVWIMNFIYGFIPNYGVAIIILTIMTKILLWPLGTKSYKSMGEMKKIQPLMAEIREKYKNDKKRMNQEVMGLYKTYKINPMGGCLPMIAQIPVFFALYRMLYEAIELRHAPFFGWINDLSAPDRLFHFNFSIPFMQPPYGIPVLTIIMGASMLLQQKMSPPPGDPAQAKMMMLMPIIFTFIFINFSSGLVLYWLTNNLLSISQQYYISKKKA